MSHLSHNSNLEIPTSDLRIPIPHSAFRIPRSRQSRHGISIIEVMTAVVVAMIGVFGTLVLIPFAVKQAQSGLDLDDARNLAVNSVASFDAMGFANEDRFIFGVRDVLVGADQRDVVSTTRNFGAFAGSPVMIDPVWVNANTADRAGTDAIGIGVSPAVGANFGFFGEGASADPAGTADPRRGQVDPPLPIDLRGIRRVTLSVTDDPVVGGPGAIATRVPSPSLMTNQQLQRLVQSSDDLVFSTFDTDDGELAGQPFQVFDRDGTGNILRRQSAGGRLSTATFLLPDGGMYRRFTLLFAERTPQLYADPGGARDISNANPRSIMASALVTTRGAILGGLPSGLQSAGGELVICPVDWAANSPPEWNQDFLDVVGSPESPGVRRDDWVMMINRLPVGYPVAGSVDRLQVQFFRVANIDEGNALGGTPNDLPSLTLDGPSFDFGPDGTPPRVKTYIIHLRDVVNVYEDTITL